MGKRILIAEDSEDIQFCLKRALELEGYETELADNGRIALEKLAEGKGPDLLLLDLMMPEVDGYSVLRNLKYTQQISLPVVAMSANRQAEQRAREEGKIAAFLIKPFALTALRQTVKAVLDETSSNANSRPMIE